MCFFNYTLLLLLEIKIIYKTQSLGRHITKKRHETRGAQDPKEDRVSIFRRF